MTATENAGWGPGFRCVHERGCDSMNACRINGSCSDDHQIASSPPLADQSAQAVIENGMIVIRVPLDNLPVILEGGWLCNAYGTRWKITDGAAFAKELVHALNHEDEEGSTPVHKLFDAAINTAIEQGPEGIEEHEEQER